jgi:hypothetical protein
MPEWLNGTVSKTVYRLVGTRVRIPVSPHIQSLPFIHFILERCQALPKPKRKNKVYSSETSWR